MATAKKLPSGSWRCLVYSHTERTFDAKSGTWKDKRIYESFTSDDPSRRGKADAERQAAEFQQDRDTNVSRKRQKNGNILLKDAMKKYVEAIGPSLSGTTVQGYSKEQYDSYAFLMEKKLKDITTEDLQKAVDDDTKRPSKRSTKTKASISPKTVRNTYSYIRSVINYFYPNDNYDVRLPKIPKKVKNLIPAKTVLEIIKDTEIELPCLLACWLSYSMSEIRGIRVRDISNGYITLDRVIVDIGQTPTVKESGKAEARLRKHHIPNYIQALIDKNISGKKPDDPLITMTFHDLRHLNASVMAMLRIPDKYAQERGGWSSDRVMKNVYTHTFSEEREKVDETIDNYFDSLLDGSASKKEKSAIEIINALREADPNGWYKALLNMQHEMQHKN